MQGKQLNRAIRVCDASTMLAKILTLVVFVVSLCGSSRLEAQENSTSKTPPPAEVQAPDAKAVESSPTHPVSVEKANGHDVASHSNRMRTLVFSLTIFALSVFVGFEVIAKVPPTLHTPLMSGSNAISGITIVGALIAAANKSGGLAAMLGLVAIVFAMINAVGGFVVTHRMLKMFKKR
jgi:H+-translocating NAD(P) transhydrogenase subunit alpha